MRRFFTNSVLLLLVTILMASPTDTEKRKLFRKVIFPVIETPADYCIDTSMIFVGGASAGARHDTASRYRPRCLTVLGLPKQKSSYENIFVILQLF